MFQKLNYLLVALLLVSLIFNALNYKNNNLPQLNELSIDPKIIIISIFLVILLVFGYLSKFNIGEFFQSDDGLYNTNIDTLPTVSVDELPVPPKDESVPMLSTGGDHHNPIPDAELILYYTNWCGMSQEFMPVWRQYREFANQNKKHLKVTEILCEGGNEAYCQQCQVEGFPTVRLHIGDETFMYGDYPRTLDSLKKFVDSHVN